MLRRLPAGHTYRDIRRFPVRKITCLPVLSVFAAALILSCSILSLAQNRERFVISAKAGGINAISGQATVTAKGESDWQQLMITDDLNAGDRVRTDYDGRIEILLNPGSFLRVGSNSEVELSNNSLDNLEFRLIKGTAIVEATGPEKLDLNINVSTPHAKLAIVRYGLYRLSVVPGDTTELIVRKGRVILSDDAHTNVKDGNKVVFSQTNTSVAKMTKEDKKLEQDIDKWSAERAGTVAQANRRITRDMMAMAFRRSYDPFFDVRYTRGFGLWFYNPVAGCYTVLPWYYGWRSPYGSYYTTNTYNPYAGHGYGGRGGASSSNPPSTRSGSRGGGSYPSSGGSGGARPVSPSGGYGNGGGSRTTPMRQPVRMIDSDTGRAMPRKSMEVNRP
jgi:hypothetical protein